MLNRDFSVESLDSKLFGAWLSGFTDGEGSFLMHLYKRPKRKNSYGITIGFQIGLRSDDREILNKVRDYLGCGNVYPQGFEGYYHKSSRREVKFMVYKIQHLKKIIIPLFEYHNLRAKKRADFDIWKLGVDFIYQSQMRRGLFLNGSAIRTNKYTDLEIKRFSRISTDLRLARAFKETGEFR